jgi:putative SOS response-associated peptidase YedK
MAKDFGVEEITDDLQPSYNIAPTQDVAVIVNREKKKLVSMRWGLVPYWSTDPSGASKLINARAETLRSRAALK